MPCGIDDLGEAKLFRGQVFFLDEFPNATLLEEVNETTVGIVLLKD